MAECPYFEHLLVMPRLRVQNANAISSPLTHGFPSITAFLGLMWALERETHRDGLDLQFNAVGVIAHSHEEQRTGGFVHSFHLTRNPVDKDGGTAAIVEEGRIHLDISLVFAVQSPSLTEQSGPTVAARVRELLDCMRIAGGSVIASATPRRRQTPYVLSLTSDEAADRAKLFDSFKLRLLPGFALVERADLLDERMAGIPDSTRLEAWLSLSRINWRWQDADDRGGRWQHDREGLGWIVPIPLGYGALGDLQPPGSVAGSRDSTTSFRFVESLYGIGQWLSPHRLHSPQQLLWYADSEPENGLYRCRNDYRPTPAYALD
ncbi:type I-F CRISPR-associated protein Csy2 [Methyloversatilis sp. XJ19-13]|uniref:type I-F CRISPR-associated protein Csy2 n=1 Tax=Methyloversatilis sp. XJ19-13 TaxID=2963430 RepID=UPI00211C427A|nr:type I-F CRISPR-associated protein Csy2 [Methyloversatilis sp. XJ19-13]MCQ9376374.1 type I-F CRISPR-associated protein Csy2 [Methyloversatilis sp. XJ19-13]